MDDFTKYSNSFKYLRHIFDKFHPVSLPSVSIQTPTVLDLLQDDFKGKVHEVYSSGKVIPHYFCFFEVSGPQVSPLSNSRLDTVLFLYFYTMLGIISAHSGSAW